LTLFSKYSISFLITAAVISADEAVLADGCMLLPRIGISYKGKAEVSSDAQQALLLWQEGVETLHVRSTYTGPTTDFAWVIPVPGRPTVERSSWDLFEQAEKATRPQVTVEKAEVFRGLNIGCSAPTTKVGTETLPTGVRQIETLAIRELHIDIVQASNSGGFLRWLDNHQYVVTAEAKPIFQEYIDKGFYFIVTKINKSSAWAKRKDVTETVSGGLTPLAIGFATERPFYPLAISAISSASENELLLLCAARERLDPVEYASTELSGEDVEDTIAPIVRKTGNALVSTALDFAPAIRAAQGRMAGPSLVVESAIEMAWHSKKPAKLARKGSRAAGDSVRLTRFHAFLKPRQMRDITFVRAKNQELLEGRFYIPLRRRYKAHLGTNVSAWIMLLGLCSAAASRRKAWRKGPLQTLALGLLLLAMALA